MAGADLAYQRVSPNSVLLRAGWTAQLVVVGPLVSIWKFWLLYCKDFCPDFSSMFCVVDFDLYRRSIPALVCDFQPSAASKASYVFVHCSLDPRAPMRRPLKESVNVHSTLPHSLARMISYPARSLVLSRQSPVVDN